MSKLSIHTPEAPPAAGPYSQAIAVGPTVYLAGQIGLHPLTGAIAENFTEQAHQALRNLRAVARTSGGDLSDVVKLGVFVVDLEQFAALNEVMTEYFSVPYPARTTIQAAKLPKGGLVEFDAVMVLSKQSR